MVDQRHFRYKFPLNFATINLIFFYPPKWRGCLIPEERQLGVFLEGEKREGESNEFFKVKIFRRVAFGKFEQKTDC